MGRSATVPEAGQSEAQVLDARAEAWRSRPLLREIYHGYFREMVAQLAVKRDGNKYGLVVELGGGSGNFREFFPAALTTDLVPTRHVQVALDALRLPFADGTLDNLVLQDVLHHLPYPLAFFAEATRVLRVGGRVVMTEPFISPASRLVFRLTHPEPVDMHAKLFGPEKGTDPAAFSGRGAFTSNQAIPTLLFFRDLAQFERRFPRLQVRQRLLRSLLVYPLSGGFSGPKLIPDRAVPLAWRMERILTPLARLLAFRVLLVVEKVE